MKNLTVHFTTPLLLLYTLLMFPITAYALDPVYSNFLGQAIRGYDPVAYFKDSRPVEGERKHSARWNDATWYFSSDENRLAFIADPERYAPQYGGYCAWAVSQGYTASIDPEAWTIHDGKLYLNYSKSVQKQWSQDIPGNIDKGNTNWPGLLSAR